MKIPPGDESGSSQVRLAARTALDEAIARVARDEAVRMLESQARRLEGARARAATVIGVAGIGATFVATRAGALDGPALYLSSASVLLFAAAIAIALWALMPQDQAFGFSATDLLEDIGKGENDLTAFYAQLAEAYQAAFVQNEQVGNRTLARFQWGVALLVVGLVILLSSMLFAF